MIPSRPLHFADLFSQLISIFGRIFTRYAALFLVFFVPLAILFTFSVSKMLRDGVHIAQSRAGFNDQDLVDLRNRIRTELYKNNPALEQQVSEEKAADSMKVTRDSAAPAEADSARPAAAQPTASTRPSFHATHFITQYASDFAPDVFLFFGAVFLFSIGLTVLNAGTTDLACQAFEERAPNLGFTFGDTFRRHFWRVIALMMIWLVGSIALSVFRELMAGVASAAGDFFLFVLSFCELFLMVRFSLAVPAIVSEGLGPIAGMARSWNLTGGHFLRLFGYFVGIFLLMLGISVILFFISAIFVAGSSFIWWRDFLQMPTITIAYFLGGITSFCNSMTLFFSIPIFLLFPFASIFATLLYYDLRTRKEGPLMYSDSGTEPEASPMWQP